LDDDNAAHIAYAIGSFHPDHGKTPVKTGTPKVDPKGNGALTTEQMKRVETNTQRRASSASVAGGGGKRVISVDDVDLATIVKMSPAERLRFSEKHPDQYAKLLRG
jgi:hypothetical protein